MTVTIAEARAAELDGGAYDKASDTGAEDRFGSSVSLSGDSLAVGALHEASAATGVNGNQADNSAGGGGAVYVFVRTGTIWTQQAYLKASNTGAYDWSTCSVDATRIRAEGLSRRIIGPSRRSSVRTAPETASRSSCRRARA
jgi:hypothetical protein